MAALTSPAAAGAQIAGGAQGTIATSPAASGFGAPAGEELAAVASGLATQYWVELLAYPPGTARSLWLQVSGAWKRYDNSPAHWEDMVQRAFASGQTVRVWYNGAVIVGLVVNS